MAKIAYFVHGRGRGHGSRSAPIIANLRAAGHTVCVFAGGDALSPLGEDPDRVPVTPVMPGPLAVLHTVRGVRSARRQLKDAGVELLITDGDGPSLFAAQSLGVSSIAIGHGLVFRYGKFQNLPKLSILRESINVASSSLGSTRKIAVHFSRVQSRDPSVRIARPDLSDLPDQNDTDQAPRGDGSVSMLCYFRDGNGEVVLRSLLALGTQVSLFGNQVQPDHALLQRPNGTHATFVEHLGNCDAVVASAGSNLLSECVALGKPVLALYKKSDHEQRLNALLIAEARVGMACTFEDATEATLRKFKDRVRAQDFARYPLLDELPPVSQCVEACVQELLRR